MSEKKGSVTKKETVNEKKTIKKTTAKKEDVKEKKTTRKVTSKPTKNEEKTEKKVIKKAVPKKEVAKKEVVKEKKTTKKVSVKKDATLSLPKKEQNIFKTLSRIVAVIAKILRIILMIAAPIILIVMILIPIFFSKVEVSGNIVKINDARLVLKDDYVTLNVGDKTHLLCDGVKNIDEIVTFLNDNSIGKIIASFELTLLFGVFMIIVNIYIFKDMESLFNNFYTKETPFISENSTYIWHIAQKMAFMFLANIVFGIALALFAKNALDINYTSYGLIEILIVFILYYIFKYATIIQSKTNASIYD